MGKRTRRRERAFDERKGPNESIRAFEARQTAPHEAWLIRHIEEEWDRAEAEYLEQR